VSWGLKLSTDQVGAVMTIATAAITLVTAFAVRPVSLPLIKGSAATILVAFSAFGLHLTANQVGYSTAVLSIVIGLLLRQNVVPASAAAKGSTAAHEYGITA
jgi:hydrogenase-4 membrane subunit HyfE